MMTYEYILVRYGEMTTKGKNRSKFVSTLKDNVKFKLKKFPNIKIDATHDAYVHPIKWRRCVKRYLKD